MMFHVMNILSTLLLASTLASGSALRYKGGKGPSPRERFLALRDRSGCPPPSKAVDLHRLFQNNNELYQITTRSVEKSDTLDGGYEYDGTPGRVFGFEEAMTTPLYHVYNDQTRDNFYTVDADKRDEFLSLDSACVDKGTVAHVFARRVCGSKPLYRLYNPETNSHFYTLDEAEVDEAIAERGYDTDPAIAGFVLPKATRNDLPAYRFVQP